MARKKRVRKHADPVVEQLDQIKRLIMLRLIVTDTKANTIAKVLGVGKATVSRLVPARLIKKRGAKR
jgi:DNA-directed RNA polymerase specialized sigma subunit